MEFVVDKVSEDSFYENLLIGLPKVLEKLPNVTDLLLERFAPVQHNTICAWEQKYGVLLPEDLRCFYASTNGLLYTYHFFYRESKVEEDRVIGKIEVNSFNDLVPIYGYEISSEPGVDKNGELKLGADSKVFELVNINDLGRVVLVYINHRHFPTIWIHNSAMKFYFLAENITIYLRMCIHHLGIPFWQFSFCDEGIPECSEMVFRLLAPAILPLHKKNEDMKNNQRLDDFSNMPLNKIDANIFRNVKLQNSSLPTNDQNLSPRSNKNKKPTKPKSTYKAQKKTIQNKLKQ